MGCQALPRAWWSWLDLPRDEVHRTYRERPLDQLPRVLDDPELRWLAGQPTLMNSLVDTADDGYGEVPLTAKSLGERIGKHTVPRALARLVGEPSLAARLSMPTASFIDLAERAVPTTDGGLLVHLVSDSQYVLHWLVHLGPDGHECVMATPEAIGWRYDAQEEWPDPPPPDLVDLAGPTSLQVCADSIAEFLRRVWIENQIFTAQTRRQAVHADVHAYAQALGLDLEKHSERWWRR